MNCGLSKHALGGIILLKKNRLALLQKRTLYLSRSRSPFQKLLIKKDSRERSKVNTTHVVHSLIHSDNNVLSFAAKVLSRFLQRGRLRKQWPSISTSKKLKYKIGYIPSRETSDTSQ